jgi:hypothetical protein
MWDQLEGIERQTMQALGDGGGFFVDVSSDCTEVVSAIMHVRREGEPVNLVFHVTAGLFKEVRWFHFLLVSGNYPLLNSRLRYVWEGMSRAYLAETSSKAPASADDKLDWIEGHKPRLDWGNCVSVVLKEVCPATAADEGLLQRYCRRWQELNQYVHPSAPVLRRMIGDSALHLVDAFDEQWARDTIEAGRDVFGVVLSAILRFHPLAIPKLVERGFFDRHPKVREALAGCGGFADR